MQYKAIVFDLDGTVADTIPLTIYSLKEVIRTLSGKELSDEEILREFGPVDTEIVKKFVSEELKEQSVELYIQKFSEAFDHFVTPIQGMSQLLEYITSKGIHVALFTGRGLRAAKIVLEKLHIMKHFNTIVAGDHTKNPKPDPEGIHIALDKLGVKAADSIYVGDFDVDIKASRAAGTTSVLALWSSTGSEDLIHLKPDKFFRSTYEFIDWLGEP